MTIWTGHRSNWIKIKPNRAKDSSLQLYILIYDWFFGNTVMLPCKYWIYWNFTVNTKYLISGDCSNVMQCNGWPSPWSPGCQLEVSSCPPLVLTLSFQQTFGDVKISNISSVISPHHPRGPQEHKVALIINPFCGYCLLSRV